MCVLCMYKPAAYSGGMTCSMKGKALLDSISVLAVKNQIIFSSDASDASASMEITASQTKVVAWKAA